MSVCVVCVCSVRQLDAVRSGPAGVNTRSIYIHAWATDVYIPVSITIY